MRPPSFRTRVTGHPLFCVLTYGFLAMAVYGWFTSSETPIGVVLLAVVMAATTKQARSKVLQYRAWEREWAGIDDARPKRRTGTSLTLFLGLVCMGSTIWAMSYPANGNAQDRLLVQSIAVLTGLGFVMGLSLKAVRTWLSRPARATGTVVRVSLPVPRHTPTVREATAALPSYCKELLSRSNQ